MFLKAITSFILAHALIFGTSKPYIYVAPAPTPVIKMTAASTTPPKLPEKLSKAKPAVKKIKEKTSSKNTKPTQATTTEIAVLPPEPPPDFEAINTFARKALVNIFCTTKGSELSPISGTGVIISPQGIILTNAHIGQFFLLRNFRQKDFVECVIRNGSPASPRYHAELVYISPTWVTNNKTILKDQDPKGTGENDFAFLRITETLDGSSLPTEGGHVNLPYITSNVRSIIDKGEPVVLVSYPAGFLGGLAIIRDLNITSAITGVQSLFTFKENTIDLISVPGTIISQKGASGGAVVDRHATLLGIISTSSNADETKERDLRAITLSYIDRELQSETGMSLLQFLTQDTAVFAKTFQNNTAPALTKMITDELSKNQ